MDVINIIGVVLNSLLFIITIVTFLISRANQRFDEYLGFAVQVKIAYLQYENINREKYERYEELLLNHIEDLCEFCLVWHRRINIFCRRYIKKVKEYFLADLQNINTFNKENNPLKERENIQKLFQNDLIISNT